MTSICRITRKTSSTLSPQVAWASGITEKNSEYCSNSSSLRYITTNTPLVWGHGNDYLRTTDQNGSGDQPGLRGCTFTVRMPGTRQLSNSGTAYAHASA